MSTPASTLRRTFAAAAIATALTPPIVMASQPSFQGLGFYRGRGTVSTGVSADGAVVLVDAGGRGLLWTAADGLVDFSGWPSSFFAFAISGDGSTVVGDRLNPGVEAFRWTSETGMVDLGILSGIGSTAYGVSSDGSVIVGTSDGTAFHWTAAGVTWLGGNTTGQAVSADGSVVVGRWMSLAGAQGFRWTAEDGIVGLGQLQGGNYSEAVAVSADGSSITGWGYSANGPQAFRWTSDTGMEGLGDLPGGDFRSEAYAISADGSVVVGESQSDAGRRAFIWDVTHGMRPLEEVLAAAGLDFTGWTLVGANGISADGRTIVGFGVNPNEQGEAWIAHIPEPATFLLLALAAPAVLRRSGPRRRIA